MANIVWQLPVNQDRGESNQIHHNAKYHAFINDNSVCGKYGQTTDFFETDIEESELMLKRELACKKCLKKLNLQ